MADATHATRLGVIVPRRLRADWRQEWEAGWSAGRRAAGLGTSRGAVRPGMTVLFVSQRNRRVEMARVASITMDRRVLGFTLLISLLTGLLFGLMPALQLSADRDTSFR